MPAWMLVPALAAWVAAAAAPEATAPEGEPELRDARDPLAERFLAARKALLRDRRDPRGIVALAKLHALEDELPELASMAAAYGQAAADPKAHPEVRGLARFYLAGVERARGNLRKVEANLGQMGFIEGWQILGPFDNEGKIGFEQAYPPEKELNLAASHPGKVGEVSWRPLPPESQSMGFVALGHAFHPDRQVTAYALAVVDSPRDQQATLGVGASGAVKVFVNGELAIADPAYHPPRLDQALASVPLRRGPNAILVKLSHDEGWFGFYARLTEPDGDGLDLKPVTPPVPPQATTRAGKIRRLEGAVEVLERRAAKAKKSAAAAAHFELAIALAERRSADERERRAAAEASRAAALAPGSVEVQLLAARFEEDHNRRRAHLEAAREASPGDPWVRLALAAHELDRGRPHRAVELAEEAVMAAPRLAAARVLLNQAYEQVGLPAMAAREAAELTATFPTHPPVVAAAAQAARRLERSQEAMLLLRKGLALRLDDAGARQTLTQILIERGDVEAAIREMDVGLRLEPGDLHLRLHKADLLAANGQTREAEEAYAAAVRIAPQEAEAWERRGRSRLRANMEKEALADLERALHLRPQSPMLKELVRSLQPARERFERPWIYDWKSLISSSPRPGPEDDALILGDLKVTKVFPSGMSATYNQLVVRVVTSRGADEHRTQSIGYAPDRQELRVERARILKPDGTVVEAHQESEQSTSEPWYRLYYDNRNRVLTFPNLAAGDVLEVAYRLEDVASDNLLSDYFGELTFLQEGTRKVRADYVLVMPPGRKIHASSPTLPRLQHDTRTLPGGETVHRWSALDVTAVQPEPGMPGWSEVAAFVHVSTYADWGQVASFYWGLIREQLTPNAEVREAAARIAERVGRRDELAIIKAVYDFVVTNTRYVGLEFGIHGYKPYRVEQVLSRRFGDCKDKASLAHAMLASLGIDSRIALLRMRRLGRIPESPASLAVFNHAVLYVPKYDLWLDGTASYAGSRDLPSEDRGATILVVNPGEPPRFGYVPEAKPEDNITESTYDVVLAPDGAASVKGSSRVAGVQAPGYRRAYRAEGERVAAFEQAWSRTFPGLKVNQVSLSDLTRLEEDVTMRFSLSVGRYAQAEGPALRFTPFGQGTGYLEAYAPLSVRRFDLIIGDPWSNRFSYRYTLPPGWKVEEVPAPVTIDSPFGRFTVRYQTAGGLTAEGEIAFKAARVKAADYPAFRAFVAEVDRAMSRQVKVAGPAGRGDG
jgi:tetratricopeptide (TPR) repeat protein/transglutaminase-like putative cysteine protease